MQLRKTEIEKLIELAKSSEFGGLKLNHDISMNQRKLDKELKEIENMAKEQEKPADRYEKQLTNTILYHDIEDKSIKTELPDDEYSLKSAFLYNLFSEKSIAHDNTVSDTTERYDLLESIRIIDAIKDVKLSKDTALKVAENVKMLMSKEKEIRESEPFMKKMENDINRNKLMFSLFEKDKEGTPKFDDSNQPKFKDDEQANKKLANFDKKNKEVNKAFNDYINEKINIDYIGISIDELPEDLSKKDMDVLIEFIKEEE